MTITIRNYAYYMYINGEATKRLKWAHCDINIADEFGPFDMLPHIKHIPATPEVEY